MACCVTCENAIVMLGFGCSGVARAQFDMLRPIWEIDRLFQLYRLALAE